jgi:predicted RNA binding protein YcfA (HicA-like mRNA interferase family)
MKGKELVNILLKRGWVLKNITGSHHILENRERKIVSIPCHNKDLKPGTLNTLLKQAGLK